MKNKNNDSNSSKTSLLDNNKVLAVISVLIAVILWGIVQVNYSEDVTNTLSELPITFDNILKDTEFVAYVNNDVSATVTLSGKSYNISSAALSKEDIIVEPVNTFVDSTGTKVVSLSARFVDPARMSDVEITKVYPSTVQVYFDREATESFNVVAKLSNKDKNLVKGEYVLGQPVPSVNVMEISGPQTIVSAISEVCFEAEIDKEDLPLTESKELDATVTFGNVSDKHLPFLSYDAFDEQKNPAKITVPVYVTKEVPTEVKFIGQPPRYADSAPSYKITPSQVKITYNPQDVQQIETFSVGTIDFKTLTANVNSFAFSLDEAASANLADKTANEFTVTVDMSDMDTKQLEAIPSKIVLSGKVDGYTYTAKINEGLLDNIVIVGPSEALEKITADDLQIEINVSEIDPEKEKLKTVEITNISIQSEQFDDCWVYGTNTASITIE